MFQATYLTQHMQHMDAIIETCNAFMLQWLMIMLHDAHDQNFNCLLTSRMLHRQCCMDGSARERAPPCGSCGYCLLLHTNLVVSAALESCIVIKSSICILLSIVWSCAVGIMKFVGFLP